MSVYIKTGRMICLCFGVNYVRKHLIKAKRKPAQMPVRGARASFRRATPHSCVFADAGRRVGGTVRAATSSRRLPAWRQGSSCTQLATYCFADHRNSAKAGRYVQANPSAPSFASDGDSYLTVDQFGLALRASNRDLREQDAPQESSQESSQVS